MCNGHASRFKEAGDYRTIMMPLSDSTASRSNVRGLENGYETDPCEYFNALKQRIGKEFSRPESPHLASVESVEESANTALSSLSSICKQNLKRDMEGEHIPWHYKNRVKDRKLLNRLRAFRSTIGGSQFWEEAVATDQVQLRRTGASKEHGRGSLELTCALDAEIQELETELEAHEQIWGSTRGQNDFGYDSTGIMLVWCLRDYGVPYAFAEAAVLLWHSGAQELVQEVDVINPLFDRSVEGKDPRDGLDSIARKRWNILRSEKSAKSKGRSFG